MASRLKEILPTGMRNSPTDEELMRYVKRKNGIIDPTFHCPDIYPKLDIYQYPPDELPADQITKGKNGELYFFTERDTDKSKQNRTVGNCGSWKTLNSRTIYDEGEATIGQKTDFVFYTGRGRERKKTEWMMQEYSLIDSTSSQGCSSSAKDVKNKVGGYVLCKIYKKNTKGVPSTSTADAYGDENEKTTKFWTDIHGHADDEDILTRFWE